MRWLLCWFGLVAATISVAAQSYLDRSLPPEERAKDLVQYLTLEEKASLLLYDSPVIERLGIPQYNWWNEALHGVARNGSATVFPQPIGMASSFDISLIESVFTAVSDEARVKNRLAREAGESGIYQGLTFWTPNINIFRDPRWGRGMETYGEDPYLTGQLGMAVVRGLQGPSNTLVRKAHACAKHFAVHSGPESLRHSFDARVSERDLRETYLPAFKDLVTKADVQEVMTAYNRFRGYPCAVSDNLVNQILRGEWNYQGLVVSDCWAISDLFEPDRHGTARDAAQAAAMAVKNGVDVECGVTYHRLAEAVSLGYLNEADLDRNLLRVLTERFRLGEIDGESPWDDLDSSLVEGNAHRELSVQMARESLVLLQNRDDVLPLRPGTKIALLGPNADDAEMMWGNYNPVPNRSVTLLQALQERVPGLVYFRGCGLLDAELRPVASAVTEVGYSPSLEEDLRILSGQFLPALDENAVLRALEGVDVVVFAGGLSPRLEGEEMSVQVPGFFGGDRTDIELPDVQRRLLKALHHAGKKVILVSFSGGALGLVPETETCDAILQVWYPGQYGGTAIADVLFGDYNPSGKLPVTFYRNAGQLPAFEDYRMEGHTYRFLRERPLFSFGHGLSYTTFRFGKARLRKNNLVIPVKNTGKRTGTEVVQLYVRKVGDPLGPVKTLRGFVRSEILPGKIVKVCIPLQEDIFTWWDDAVQDMHPVHGRYELLYGGTSDDQELQSIIYQY